MGGLLYWQAANRNWSSGSGLSSVTGVRNPLLLVEPTLLLIALTLLVLRLWPWVARLVVFGCGAIVASPASIPCNTSAARQFGSGRIVFLITLAAGLTLFASLFRHSLTTRQTQLAHYLNGADLPDWLTAGVRTKQNHHRHCRPPRRNQRFPGLPQPPCPLGGQDSRQATLLAVDPASLGNVSRLAPDVSNLALGDILPALATPGPVGVPGRLFL